MTQIPDDPIIQRMERTGYGWDEPERRPRCPCCGQECEIVYKDHYGDILGCDFCLTGYDAWEEDECMERYDTL